MDVMKLNEGTWTCDTIAHGKRLLMDLDFISFTMVSENALATAHTDMNAYE